MFFFVSRRPHLLHPRVIGALKFKTTTDLFALLKSLNCQSSERASRLQCFCVRARVCVCVSFFSFLFSKHLQNIPSLLDRACGGRYLFLSLSLCFFVSLSGDRSRGRARLASIDLSDDGVTRRRESRPLEIQWQSRRFSRAENFGPALILLNSVVHEL